MTSPEQIQGTWSGQAAVGEQTRLERVAKLIVSAFVSPGALKMHVKYKLGKNLYGEIVERNAALDYQVFRLLEFANSEGITVLLMRSFIEARPNRADLHEAIKEFCPQAIEPPSPPEVQAQIVVTAVESLESQIKTPEVRSVIINSRERLGELKEGIDLISNYLALLDRLKRIQLGLYPIIERSVKKLRTDPASAEELATYILELEHICGEMRSVAASLPDKAPRGGALGRKAAIGDR